MRFCLLLLVLSLAGCGYGYNVQSIKNPDRIGYKDTLVNRYYVMHESEGKKKHLGYMEEHEKVIGAKVEIYYLVFDKLYKKLGYADEYGKTYRYIGDTERYTGAGPKDMICKMVFQLSYDEYVYLEGSRPQ
ncbi:MAG: hypothetical protein HY606_00900 [Planctomycetes bacterium]|nr:hypothetical protein [Planctomycetota bacterium]